jgi:transposase
VERTIELARTWGGFGARALRAALDASPLWGAGRVEDTINLLGHALRKALGVIARQQGRGLSWRKGITAVADQAGVPRLGGPSVKAALDRDWDDPVARDQALGVVLETLERVEGFVADQQLAGPGVQGALGAARQVVAQDVQADEETQVPPTLRRGVAKDRRISIEDPQMPRPQESQPPDRRLQAPRAPRPGHRPGPAVGVTPANLPEAAGAEQIRDDLAAQQATLAELFIDRAYLSSTLVRDRPDELAIFCKAWRVRNGPRFAKTAFTLDFTHQLLVCPAGQQMAFVPGGKVQFPAEVCAASPLRAQCTTSTRGRSVQIHPDEQLLAELRAAQQTPAGRAKLRERVKVEHTLAHLGHWQGRRARYVGPRKNLFDLRRVAVVHNLHVLARAPWANQQAA